MENIESFTGLELVRKMIADMIWGPAIIVMARGPSTYAAGPRGKVEWPSTQSLLLDRNASDKTNRKQSTLFTTDNAHVCYL